MVSKARDDLPEPESPVTTVRRSRGISTLTFFRLCWRAPRTVMRSIAIAKKLPRALQYAILRPAETTIVNESRRGGQATRPELTNAAGNCGTRHQQRRLMPRKKLRKADSS